MKPVLVSMYVGETGSGKTFNLGTYPKVGCLMTEPNSHWTWEMNPSLKKNIVDYEYFIPEDNDSFKDYFKRVKDKIQLYKKMFTEGKIETLGIDNMTYLLRNRWLWQERYQFITSNRTGEMDKQSMYGQLRSWAYEFMLLNVLSFKGNIVVNVHEMLESENALDKKVDKSIDKVPNLLGGFRDDIGGLFSNIFYLSKVEDKTRKGGYKYIARTNKGNGRLAKNRFNLPVLIEDVSYQAICRAIENSTKSITP